MSTGTNLRLVIIEGPRKGEEFVVKADIVIARKKGDLQLQDDKSSNPHARIFSDNDKIYVEDMGSSNGTKLNGTRLEAKAEIKPGDLLSMGRTLLRVDQGPAKKTSPIEEGTWQQTVDEALGTALTLHEKIPMTPRPHAPFEQPVVLEFVQGLQTGSQIIFGYGPRQLGGQCIDALFYEPGLPALAFELHPVTGAPCELRCENDKVFVNGAPAKTMRLKIGDRISIGQTVLLLKTL